MKNYTFIETANSPAIHFDFQNGTLSITGNSNCENPKMFYNDLIKATENYILKPNLETTISINMNYINSGSVKALIHILKKIEPINLQPQKVLVKWHYEHDDHDLRDIGNDFKNSIKLNFELIELK